MLEHIPVEPALEILDTELRSWGLAPADLATPPAQIQNNYEKG